MSTVTITEAKTKALQLIGITKTASKVLNEEIRKQKSKREFDVFLSHSISEAEIVLGVKGIIEEIGHSVYIDWIEDPERDRTSVSVETTETLRQRMKICHSLFYLTTPGSSNSKWMPWECGYFDGLKQKAAILPVTHSASDSYQGREYLGLYPYIATGRTKATKEIRLWVHRSQETYVEFSSWLNVQSPKRH